MATYSERVCCSFLHQVLLFGVLILKLTSSGTSAALEEDRTYPEEVHQRVIEKLNKLHGKSTFDEGSWGPWSPWTHCSRSCDTGVKIQSRQCLPKSSRKRIKVTDEKTEYDCVGHYKRYQLCNTQICSGGPVDFRKEQCANFNRTPFNKKFYTWEPFMDGHESCTLNCRAVGLSFYATLNQSVIDGTACGPYLPYALHINKVCVEGRCMKLGCDGLLGSGREIDACGICGGDNSTCRVISGVYTKSKLPFGYNLIATLPPHAQNLSFYHLKPSTNYLALREPGGRYLLNGPSWMNSSSSFAASGTIFTYSRPHANGGDHLYARGPITHSLDVMLFYQNIDPGIRYEYRLPISPPASRTFGSTNEQLRYGKASNSVQSSPPLGTLSGHDSVINAGVYGFSPSLRASYQNSINPAYPDFQSNLPADDPSKFSMLQRNADGSSNYRSRAFQNTITSTDFTDSLKFPSGKVVNQVTSNFPWLPHSSISFTNRQNSWNTQHPNSLTRYQPTNSLLNSQLQHSNPSKKFLHPTSFKPFAMKDKEINSVLSFSSHGSSWHDFSHHRFGKIPQSERAPANHLPSPLSYVTNHLSDNISSDAYSSPRLSHSISVHSARTISPSQGPVNDDHFSHANLDRQLSDGSEEPWRKRKFERENDKTLSGDNGKKYFHKKYSETARRKRYIWIPQGFTLCSQSCGGGTQRTRNICVKRNRKEIEVPASFCANEDPTPADTVRCNLRPCQPHWEPAEWNLCSVTCGLGVQLRKLICKQRLSPEEIITLPPDACQEATTLLTSQVCQMRDCDGPPSWELGPWSSCSSPCGLGTRRRNVTCATVSGYVDRHQCDTPKPTEEEMCDMGSCATDTWFFSSWEKTCSGPCGAGIQRRRISCSGNPLYGQEAASSCSRQTRPADTRKCENVSQCSGSWFTGPWNACNSRCGTGQQRRSVICVVWTHRRYKVVRDESLCKDAGDKPQDTRSCATECISEWFTSQWSECSQSCGGGVQRREVKCLDDQLQPSMECSEAYKPDTRQSCNNKSCNSETEKRTLNEVSTPLQTLQNDSSSIAFSSGKSYHTPFHKAYHYYEQGSATYVESKSNLEPPESSERDWNDSRLDSALKGTFSESVKGVPNFKIANRNTYSESNRGPQQTVARNISTAVVVDESRNSNSIHGGNQTRGASPRIPWTPGMCMDRMKNCNLVYKARLCKLRYYNKLCCDTCSKH